MILTISILYDETTGDVKTAMTPQIGRLEIQRTDSGSQVVVWESVALSLGKYNEALKKQAGKPKLRSV